MEGPDNQLGILLFSIHTKLIYFITKGSELIYERR
nr:MAG TPA: hypothetical protein [Caudoviricetes sp.]